MRSNPEFPCGKRPARRSGWAPPRFGGIDHEASGPEATKGRKILPQRTLCHLRLQDPDRCFAGQDVRNDRALRFFRRCLLPERGPRRRPAKKDEQQRRSDDKTRSIHGSFHIGARYPIKTRRELLNSIPTCATSRDPRLLPSKSRNDSARTSARRRVPSGPLFLRQCAQQSSSPSPSRPVCPVTLIKVPTSSLPCSRHCP